MKAKPKKPLHVYLIDDGARHWYVATSEGNALAQYAEDSYGGSVEDYLADYPETTVTQCDDDKTLTINFDPDHEIDGNQEETKTFAEWVEERDEGRLCSTEW